MGKKWHDLGVDLLEDDSIENLNKIKCDKQDINTCCTEMFQLWLSKQFTASWNQLIDSLRQPHISLGTLAIEIEQMLLQPKPTGIIHIAFVVSLVIKTYG